MYKHLQMHLVRALELDFCSNCEYESTTMLFEASRTAFSSCSQCSRSSSLQVYLQARTQLCVIFGMPKKPASNVPSAAKLTPRGAATEHTKTELRANVSLAGTRRKAAHNIVTVLPAHTVVSKQWKRGVLKPLLKRFRIRGKWRHW